MPASNTNTRTTTTPRVMDLALTAEELAEVRRARLACASNPTLHSTLLQVETPASTIPGAGTSAPKRRWESDGTTAVTASPKKKGKEKEIELPEIEVVGNPGDPDDDDGSSGPEDGDSEDDEDEGEEDEEEEEVEVEAKKKPRRKQAHRQAKEPANDPSRPWTVGIVPAEPCLLCQADGIRCVQGPRIYRVEDPQPCDYCMEKKAKCSLREEIIKPRKTGKVAAKKPAKKPETAAPVTGPSKLAKKKSTELPVGLQKLARKLSKKHMKLVKSTELVDDDEVQIVEPAEIRPVVPVVAPALPPVPHNEVAELREEFRGLRQEVSALTEIVRELRGPVAGGLVQMELLQESIVSFQGELRRTTEGISDAANRITEFGQYLGTIMSKADEEEDEEEEE